MPHTPCSSRCDGRWWHNSAHDTPSTCKVHDDAAQKGRWWHNTAPPVKAQHPLWHIAHFPEMREGDGAMLHIAGWSSGAMAHTAPPANMIHMQTRGQCLASRMPCTTPPIDDNTAYHLRCQVRWCVGECSTFFATIFLTPKLATMTPFL